MSVVEKAFVLGVRALEKALGITCDSTLGNLTDSIALPAYNSAVPIIAKLAAKYGLTPLGGKFTLAGNQAQCLTTQSVFCRGGMWEDGH